jgi:hypothetical protein
MELPDIFRLVYNRQLKGDTPLSCSIPDSYRFGKGHVSFFYDKLWFLLGRHNSLIQEMHHRGYQASHLVVNPLLKDHWFGHWTPPPEAVELSRQRIAERLKGMI